MSKLKFLIAASCFLGFLSVARPAHAQYDSRLGYVCSVGVDPVKSLFGAAAHVQFDLYTDADCAGVFLGKFDTFSSGYDGAFLQVMPSAVMSESRVLAIMPLIEDASYHWRKVFVTFYAVSRAGKWYSQIEQLGFSRYTGATR